MTEAIGFVGLGNMGFPMSNCLLKAGYKVVGCDLSPGVRERFEALGGAWAATPRRATSMRGQCRPRRCRTGWRRRRGRR